MLKSNVCEFPTLQSLWHCFSKQGSSTRCFLFRGRSRRSSFESLVKYPWRLTFINDGVFFFGMFDSWSSDRETNGKPRIIGAPDSALCNQGATHGLRFLDGLESALLLIQPISLPTRRWRLHNAINPFSSWAIRWSKLVLSMQSVFRARWVPVFIKRRIINFYLAANKVGWRCIKKERRMYTQAGSSGWIPRWRLSVIMNIIRLRAEIFRRCRCRYPSQRVPRSLKLTSSSRIANTTPWSGVIFTWEGENEGILQIPSFTYLLASTTYASKGRDKNSMVSEGSADSFLEYR